MTTATCRPRSYAAHTADWRRRPAPATSSWRNRAACYNRPESWWDGDNDTLTARARQICLTCPVLTECLGEQMQDEASTMWNRTLVRGGLTGPERTQLFLDEREGGPADPEEARLLALEAEAFDRPVTELAVEGASVPTLRLAARLAGERVPGRVLPSGVELRGGTSLERAFRRAEDIMRWRGEGMSMKQIASTLRIGRQSIEVVVRTYRSVEKQARREDAA